MIRLLIHEDELRTEIRLDGRSVCGCFIFGKHVIIKVDIFFNLADGVLNAAGMGFNGYDENGEALWDKFTNVKVNNIEV
jgi:hypothetical protein